MDVYSPTRINGAAAIFLRLNSIASAALKFAMGDVLVPFRILNNLAAGFLDTATGGLTARLRAAWNTSVGGEWGLAWNVDTSSTLYRVGTYAGLAFNIAITLFPPTGWLGVEKAKGTFSIPN